MFRKKSKKLPGIIFVIIIIALALAILGAVFLPIPEAYKQLAFWLLLFGITFAGAAIIKINGRRGM